VERTREFQAKWGQVTRRVPDGVPVSIGPVSHPARAGDLVVARVVRLGSNDYLENRHGRRMKLYPGNLVVGAHASASTSFLAGPRRGSVSLLTPGGLIGAVSSLRDIWDDPTELELVGSLVDTTMRPLSCDTFARALPPKAVPAVGTVVVVGTGMSCGKTTTSVGMVRGWAGAGIDVGAGKATGHGSGADRWAYLDGGAADVVDHLDFGMPSTQGYPLERLSRTFSAIRDALAGAGASVVVLELDDAVLQPETSWVLERIRPLADAVVLAAADPQSAKAGADRLQQLRLPLRALSGVLAHSALGARRAAFETQQPVYSPEQLAEGAAVRLLAPDRADV
jgi:hypothetical protein